MKPLSKAALCSTAFVFLLVLSGCDLFNLSVPEYLKKYTNGVMAAAPTLRSAHFVSAPINPAIKVIEPLQSGDSPALIEIRLMNAAKHPLILTLYNRTGGTLVPISSGVTAEMEDFRTVLVKIEEAIPGDTFQLYMDIEIDDETRRKFDPVTDFPLVVCNLRPEAAINLQVNDPVPPGGPAKAVWEMNTVNYHDDVEEVILQYQARFDTQEPILTKEYVYRKDDSGWTCDDGGLVLTSLGAGGLADYEKFTRTFPMDTGSNDTDKYDFKITLKDTYGFTSVAATPNFSLDQSPPVVISLRKDLADLEHGLVPVELTSVRDGMHPDYIRYQLNGGAASVYTGQFTASVGDTITAWSEKNGLMDSGISAATVLLDNLLFVAPGGAGNKDGSLWKHAMDDVQSAIEEAAIRPGQTYVLIQAGTYTPSTYPNIPGTQTDTRLKHFALRNGVTVIGGFDGTEKGISPGKTNPTIFAGGAVNNKAPDASNVYHVFYHPDPGNSSAWLNATAILKHVTVQGGNANGNNTFHFNNEGGGMHNYYNSPSIVDCVFRWNYGYNGGAMNNYYSSPEITGCDISENSGNVPGIYSGYHASPSITDSTFTGNIGADSGDMNIGGGGLYAEYTSSPVISGCTFKENVAGSGAGIFSLSDNLTIEYCTFIENNATVGYGGGVYIYSNKAALSYCTFTGNTAAISGGAFFARFGVHTITNSVFSGNKVTGTSVRQGGAISLSTHSVATVKDCTFSTNGARDGGGVFVAADVSQANFENCTFNGNTADNCGGAMYNQSSNAIIKNSTFFKNTAVSWGGAIYSQQGNPTITSCTITRNSSTTRGGGIYIYTGSLTLYGSILAGNTAIHGVEYYGTLDSASTGNLITNENGFSGSVVDIFVTSGGEPVLNDNGGPTKTLMIKKYGPAYLQFTTDKPWSLNSDQRGVSRILDGWSDIGAVEWQTGDPE